MMKLNQVTDCTDMFLRCAYDEHDGWSCEEDLRLGRLSVDYLFERDDNRVLVKRIDEPIVTADHLNFAETAKGYYHLLYPHTNVRVVLVCGALLVEPSSLRSGISVLSITEETLINSAEMLYGLMLN